MAKKTDEDVVTAETEAPRWTGKLRDALTPKESPLVPCQVCGNPAKLGGVCVVDGNTVTDDAVGA